MLTHKPEKDGLASAGFKFWVDGSTCMEVAESGLPAENLKPFVVRVGGTSYIPINALVFATDEKHAKQRVIDHLVYIATNAKYERPERANWPVEPPHEATRAKKFLNDLKSGILSIKSEPFPLDKISKIQWACNEVFV